MEFSFKQFYNLAIFCWSLIIIGNLYSLIARWSLLDLGAKTSSIASNLFNFALLGLFIHLRLSLNKQEPTNLETNPDYSDDEFISIVKQVKSKK